MIKGHLIYNKYHLFGRNIYKQHYSTAFSPALAVSSVLNVLKVFSIFLKMHTNHSQKHQSYANLIYNI